VEEEDLQAIIAQIEAQDDEAEDVSPMPSATKLPMYDPMERESQDTERPGGHEECAPDPAPPEWYNV